MDRCRELQELMLEYLYDLVDADQRAPMTLHLEGCATCQTALRNAQKQQQLLASAARCDFPGVKFEPPAPVEIPHEVVPPVTLTFPAEGNPARRHRWGSRHYAQAAAVLLAVLIPGAFAWDYLAAARAKDRREAHQAELRNHVRDVNQSVASLPQERDEKLSKVHHEVRARQLKVVVSGPASVQAGGVNEYQIQTRDGNDELVPSTIVAARVVDQATGAVMYEEKAVPSPKGVHKLTLPASLPIKPHAQVALQVVARRGDSRSELSDQLQLAAPVYLTHLATDKPMYNPGETVHFRSLTLDRFSLKPAADALSLQYTITLPTGEEKLLSQGVSGQLVVDAETAKKSGSKNLQEKLIQGIGAGEWRLDGDAPGGEYVLTVRDSYGRFPQQQRKFTVNNYQPARLTKTLEFSQRTYGPGDEVRIQCLARVSGGGPLVRCPVSYTVLVDDQPLDHPNKSSQTIYLTDDQGKATVCFKLPGKIERGQASVNITFSDGGNPESVIKPIPIILDKMVVDFYPEGGDLVAGVPNRVYFQAQTPQGKPADLRGRVLDGDKVVAEICTLTDDNNPGVNQGQGVFTFTPKAGHKYELAVDQPVGIKQRVALPYLKDTGVVLHVPDGVTTAHKPIAVQLHNAGKDRSLLVGAYCRGRLFDHRSVKARAGETVKLELQPAQNSGGVFRITVFEEEPEVGRSNLIPVAERLIFRHQGERLNLALDTDKKTYLPGETASLKVTSRGENQDLTPSIIMVAVVDKSVLVMADEKTARAMPTHFLLTSEVRKPEELEHADFLLTPHTLAETALDLLLGTQGWRRFAEQQPDDFRRKHPVEAARLLAAGGPEGETLLVSNAQNGPEVQKFVQAEYLRVNEEMQRRGQQLVSERETARAELTQAEADPGYRSTRDHFDRYARFGSFVRMVFPIVGMVLILVGCLCLGNALSRPVSRAMPLILSSVACAFAFVILGLIAWVHPGDALQSEKTLVAEAPWRNVAEEELVANQGQAVKADEKKNNDFPDATKRATPPPVSPGTGLGGGGQGVPQPKGGSGAEAKGGFAPGGPNPDAIRPFEPKDAKKADAQDDIVVKQRLMGMAGDGKDRDQFHAQLRQNELRKDVPGAPRPEKPRMDQNGGGFGKEGGEAYQRRARFIVREYAHQVNRTKDKSKETRSDFTETVYWHPVLVLPDGKTEVKFNLSDAVTTYQVTAFGHTSDGRIAASTTTFDARLPFSLSAETPTEITAGDKLTIPVTLTNTTDKPQTASVQLGAANNLKLVKDGKGDKSELQLATNKPRRQLFDFVATVRQGEASVRFDAESGTLGGDSVERRFKIVPEGFPVAGSISDMLEQSATHTVILPESWIKGTLQFRAEVFPSTLSDLQKGLEGLLREPGGCFEQSSTANYPNVLILQYLRSSEQNQPDVEGKARGMLGRGYTKLTSFECQNTGKQSREGYEWFGGTAPPHEALTAYGLLQFCDMAQVHQVDATMIERTRQYLLSRRTGKGGFERNTRALDTFGRAPQHITDAYIVWALTETGKDDDLTTELNALAKTAETSNDPYFLALVANSLRNRRRSDDKDLVAILKKMVKLQKDDGRLEGAEMSITASRDRDLHIETTALAMLAWMKVNDGEYRTAIDKGSKWICQQRGGSGAFGSTQATILALKALIRHAESSKRILEAGTLSLYVGDRLVATKQYAAQTQEPLAIVLAKVEDQLKPGKNKVRLEITSKTLLPSTLSWSYQTLKPVSADKVPVKLETSLDRTKVKEGESVRLKVKVENVSGQGQGMAVAIIGLPAGLALPDDLKQLKDYIRLPEDGTRPLVSMFEIRGRELVLYWRDLAPDQKVEVPIDLKCRLPGEFSGPASRAYLYYSADVRHWIDPLKVTIHPAE